MLKKKIASAIGNRPVLIKVNNVSGGVTIPLADTPVQSLEGILEFLKSIGKTDVTIAECALGNRRRCRFQTTTTTACMKKYPVRFKDLSEEGYETQYVWNNDLGAGQPAAAGSHVQAAPPARSRPAQEILRHLQLQTQDARSRRGDVFPQERRDGVGAD
jgi:hypothetical protein